jgi:DedD protein
MRKSEPELYKDKIEVSLDGRQIFYLFFGGAVIACLLFVLGVMVGKRVEARSHVGRAATTAARDPLAALDQLDATSRGAQLSFQKALAGGNPPAGQVDRAIAELDRAAAEPARADVHRDDPVPVDPMPPEERPTVVTRKAEPIAKVEARPEGKDATPEATLDAKPAAKPEAAARAVPTPARDKGATKARYTLQLSSFQDRGEAEAFLGTLSTAGYRATITESQVEGKGTYFRVRFGGYPSYEDAVAAKGEFEAKVGKIAYVTKL